MYKLLRRRFFYPGPPTFKFVGSPANARSPNSEISAAYVHTRDHRNEPMTVHCIPCYVSWVYLVEYTARRELLLFDTGVPSDFRRIQYYVEHVLNVNKEPAERYAIAEHLKLLAVSHCHLDHCGALEGYVEKGVPVAQPDMTTAYSGAKHRVQMLFEMIALDTVRWAYKKRRENPFLFSRGWLGPYWTFQPPTRTTLEDGDSLPGFEDWVAVKMPGHTTHMVGFYHTPSRLFYTADLGVKLRNGFFPPSPTTYVFAYQHTLERVRHLDVGCALFAHGGPVDTAAEDGSWMAIMDNLRSNFISRYVTPLTKNGAKKKRRNVSDVINIMLHSAPAEARPFTVEDLPQKLLPQPSSTPHAFRIVNE